jgi:glycosyltransferase involved in cell wall biosynthesis
MRETAGEHGCQRTMADRPVVSVVIPTYCHCDTIGETLDSVFAQTFRDFEVVVVDDGSPDGTGELLRPLVEQGRIRYVRQENAGAGTARNRGLHEARGEFIAFLDDDDLWPPDKLEWQVEALRARPEAVLAYGEARTIHPDGRLLWHRRNEPWPEGDVYDKFRLATWITSPGQTLIRAEVLRELGGFDPFLWGSDDWDLYIRLAWRGPFVFRPVVALDYRLHAGNASKQAIRHALNQFSVVRRHIGWNLPLFIRHQRRAGKYFVPNLMAFAERARAEGNGAGALAATALALTFLRWRLLRRPVLPLALRDLVAVLRRRGRGESAPTSFPGLRAPRDEG